MTGRTRRFLLSVKKVHDSTHPNHVALGVGAGLVHLLKWIIQDQLELASVDYLLPHKHLCGNCKSGLIPRNHILGTTCIDDIDQLVVIEMVLYEVNENGEKTEVAASFDL